MNQRQRSYDSYDKTNKLLKLTNSFYHFRNLEHIKKRKPQFGSNNPILYPKKNPHIEPFQDYFIKRQNENIQEKINKIKNRKAKAKLNDIFLLKESKIQEFKQQYKNLDIKTREKENEDYKRRIKKQKAFFDSKVMDKDYNEEHIKMLNKLKRISDNIVLPPIKNSYDNPTSMESKKYYFTESGQRSGRDYESNKNRTIGDIESGLGIFYSP